MSGTYCKKCNGLMCDGEHVIAPCPTQEPETPRCRACGGEGATRALYQSNYGICQKCSSTISVGKLYQMVGERDAKPKPPRATIASLVQAVGHAEIALAVAELELRQAKLLEPVVPEWLKELEEDMSVAIVDSQNDKEDVDGQIRSAVKVALEFAEDEMMRVHLAEAPPHVFNPVTCLTCEAVNELRKAGE